jgi:transposase
LTALLRAHNLGVDARHALTGAQIHAAAWRTRREDPATAIIRAHAHARDLAAALVAADCDLAANKTQITAAVAQLGPGLLDINGVGPVVGAVILRAWGQTGRLRDEAAFAALAGVAPIPASSGNTVRHRLNRHGDRKLNQAIHTIAQVRKATDPTTQAYIEKRVAQGKTRREATRCLKRYIATEIYRHLKNTP